MLELPEEGALVAIEMYPDYVETLYKLEPPYRRVDEGYGFYGVVLLDTKADKIQCHICGKWFRSLCSHVKNKHGLRLRDYKLKYGISLMTPLVCRGVSRRLSETSSSNPDRHKNLLLGHTRKVRNKSLRVRRGSMIYSQNSAMYKNKNGICDAQLRRRYEVVQDIVGKNEPTLHEDIREHDRRLFHVIKTRYGGITNFRNVFNFPNKKPERPKWTEESVVAGIRRLAKSIGRIPREEDFSKKEGYPSVSTIQRHLGSFRRGRIIALGLDEKRRPNADRD